MGIQDIQRVKWNANERMDLPDINADQSLMIQRVGNAVLGMYAPTVVNGPTGGKGVVFSGFDVEGVGNTYKLKGEGLAVDVNGNMIFKMTSVDYTSASKTDGTYYVHIYYKEQDITDGTRKAMVTGTEQSVTVKTRTESTFGVYDNQSAPADNDGAGHNTIACWKLVFSGGSLASATDLRPRPNIPGSPPITGAIDQFASWRTVNIAAINSYTRSATDSTLDTLTATLKDPAFPGYIEQLDDKFRLTQVGDPAHPAMRFWYVPAGTGVQTADHAIHLSFQQGMARWWTHGSRYFDINGPSGFRIFINGGLVCYFTGSGLYMGGTNRVYGLPNPSDNSDAVSLGWMNTAIANAFGATWSSITAGSGWESHAGSRSDSGHVCRLSGYIVTSNGQYLTQYPLIGTLTNAAHRPLVSRVVSCACLFTNQNVDTGQFTDSSSVSVTIKPDGTITVGAEGQTNFGDPTWVSRVWLDGATYSLE